MKRFLLFVCFILLGDALLAQAPHYREVHTSETKKASTQNDEASIKVTQSGFEPETYCLEGSCSIQLSYWAKKKGLHWRPSSGWQDSNLRPPAPKAGAITGLRYTPKRKNKKAVLFKRTANVKLSLNIPKN